METPNYLLLRETALGLRKDILTMLSRAGSGHTGGSLSWADIATYMYFCRMNFSKDNYKFKERDRLVLSKGHACPTMYAALAKLGILKDNLSELRKIKSCLQGHPCYNTEGVEISTGSLGQGLSIAAGMALAGKLDNQDYNVYCILGDGELQEGQVWEAAMFAAHNKLNRLVAIVDYNKLQIDGKTEEVMSLGDIEAKWKSFGWHTARADGHDFEKIHSAFEELSKNTDKPKVMIADTIKGKGIPSIEGKAEWHGKTPNAEELQKFMEELY